MRKWLIGLLTCLVISSIACQSVRRVDTAAGIKVWHVVIVRLNHPGDPAEQKSIVDASKTFLKIPGIRSVYVGKMLPGNRPHQDASFDVGIVMGFATHEDLDAYVAHPMHVKAVNEVIKPLAKDYTSYDFAND